MALTIDVLILALFWAMGLRRVPFGALHFRCRGIFEDPFLHPVITLPKTPAQFDTIS